MIEEPNPGASRSFGWLVWLAACVAYLAVFMWSWATLPDRVASHFDGSGAADDWSSRASFLTIQALVGVFVLAGLPLLGALTTKLPPSMVNLPNKDYWLAPERRAATATAIRDQLVLFTGLCGLFLSWFMYDTVAAQARTPQHLQSPWIALAVFVAATIVWIVGFQRRFARPGTSGGLGSSHP